MRKIFRFVDWPLRSKMATLLVTASLLPLTIAAIIDIHDAQQRLVSGSADLLAARGDQLVDQLDTFNRTYQRSVERFARLPLVFQFCRASGDDIKRLRPTLNGVFAAYLDTDTNVYGQVILDMRGTVLAATEESFIGRNLSQRGHIRTALRGVSVISDVRMIETSAGDVPTIAYLAPVSGTNGEPVAIAMFWVRADAMWNIMKGANELAGHGSFAVLFDRQGIRIGHTYSDDIVFHPGAPLDPATINALVEERRFGAKTRQLLQDARAFPEQFERATSESPGREFFHGFAPVNQKWNYGVGRRLETIPWTIFYMIPEQTISAQIIHMTSEKTIFACIIILVALGAGALFAVMVLKPIGFLAKATESIAAGNLAARVQPGHADELGQLSARFNSMAERIEVQSSALQKARDELEIRVQERTAELAQATRELQVSEERTRLIIETALDAVIAIDSSGLITDWNPQAETIFGWKQEETLGSPLADLIVPERYREAHRRGIQHYLKTGEGAVLNKRIEIAALHREGREFPVEISITPIQTNGIVTFSAFVRDITERRLAEAKLQTQLSRLDLLSRTTRAIGERQDLKSIFQVVIRSLEDNLPIDFGCVCLYDRIAESLTVTCVGVKSQSLAMELAMSEQANVPIDQNGLSRCVRGQLVHEPDITQVKFPFPQRLARGGLRSMVIAPLLVESNVFGVLIAARHETHTFSSTDCEFLRQLSEHVALAAHQSQLYSVLQRAYDDLRTTQQAIMQQERLRALGQMASGIAHDINNAISPIALYTGALLEKEPNLSPRARDYLQTIEHAIDDVAATVSRMREFYRQREQQLTLTPVLLNRLVEQVVNLTRARWNDMPQQRGIVIDMKTELASDLPPIMGVESEIREALTNLIFNAVDAMPDGGTITLRTTVIRNTSDDGSPSRQVYVEVVDTGFGMDEDTRRRCLEPFFTTKGERGTGLGLAMVYGVMQRHSADIEIESVVGKGTTIRLIFAVPEQITSVPGKVEMPHTVPSRLRILIVDDDPVLLKSLRDALENDGHVVVAANSGQGGIDAFAGAQKSNEPFAVVITDLGMPYVDGRKVASAIKEHSPSTPVIMLTGWGQRLVAEGDVPPHVDRVLSKPPKLRDLRETLTECCKSAKF